MTRAGNLSWQTDQIKFSNFQFCTIFSSQNASTWIKQKLPRTSFYKSTFPEKDAKQDSIWHDFLTPPLCWSPDWQNRWVSCEVSLTQRCTPTLAAAARQPWLCHKKSNVASDPAAAASILLSKRWLWATFNTLGTFLIGAHHRAATPQTLTGLVGKRNGLVSKNPENHILGGFCEECSLLTSQRRSGRWFRRLQMTSQWRRHHRYLWKKLVFTKSGVELIW